MKKLLTISLAVISFAATAQTTTKVPGVGKKGTATTATAGPGKFTFTISGTKVTSAGVYKNDSILVKILWNNETFNAGSYTREWDGTDDDGNTIKSPDATYKIKVLSNAVKYKWQGTIGNTSDSMTGSSKHRGPYHCMRGLVFSGSYGYFCTGYGEGAGWSTISKFNIATPQQKIPLKVSGDANFVCTDDVLVYWEWLDAGSSGNTMVFATKISDDSQQSFTNGSPYGTILKSAISKMNVPKSAITGLAVQKAGDYLFVARGALNNLYVVNKKTGAAVRTINFANVRGLTIDGAGKLWVLYSVNTIERFTINADGSLTSVSTISGLTNPLSISYGNSLLAVCDGSTSQQVKFFNYTAGAGVSTLGSEGGYSTIATVNNEKFYFSDVNGSGIGQYSKSTFVAWQSDGSYWVNDPGNFRVQHYNSSNVFKNRIMSLGSTYSVYADKNNINKVFAENLEFEINYATQQLSGAAGWSLKNNWGATINNKVYIGVPAYQTTLSNGSTYGFIRKGYNFEVVEFVPGGQVRFTGLIKLGLTGVLCSDGSYQEYTELGSTGFLRRYPLTGFDSKNNPQWGNPETLAAGTINNTIGSPVSAQINQAFSTLTNRVVWFATSPCLDYKCTIFTKADHLGLMYRGAKNTWLWQTEKSVHRNYSGPYPPAGWFDAGNLSRTNAGGSVNIVDRQIITSYKGEFWKNSQTNKFNHYYDNGLAIGQFGVSGEQINSRHAYPGMAGNANTPILVKDSVGDMYLYHGDESHHAGVHRWKITGLKTITEQVIAIDYPSTYAPTALEYTNLMAGLSWDQSLINNTAGWTRSPSNDNSNWSILSSSFSVDSSKENDLRVFFNYNNATATLDRNLGTNNVVTNWKITGKIAFHDYVPNTDAANQEIQILDANNKILAKFYMTFSGYPDVTSTFKGNSKTMYSNRGNGYSLPVKIQELQDIKFEMVSGILKISYAGYSVTAPIFDATGNWKQPKKLRAISTSYGFGGVYNKYLIIKDFKFYKEY